MIYYWTAGKPVWETNLLHYMIFWNVRKTAEMILYFITEGRFNRTLLRNSCSFCVVSLCLCFVCIETHYTHRILWIQLITGRINPCFLTTLALCKKSAFLLLDDSVGFSPADNLPHIVQLQSVLFDVLLDRCLNEFLWGSPHDWKLDLYLVSD